VSEVRCSIDADCSALAATANACQVASCDARLGVCRLRELDDCCISDSDCGELDAACLVARCPFPGSTCAAVDTCTRCETSDDCREGAPVCSEGICDGSNCNYIRNSACCGSDAECDDGDPCTSDLCGNGSCSNVSACDPATGNFCGPDDGCCVGPVVFETAFSPPPAYEARSSDPAVRWQVLRTGLAASPPAALYLGDAGVLQLGSGDGAVRADVAIELGFLPPNERLDLRFRVFADVPPADDRGGLTAYLHTPGQRVPVGEAITPSREWRWRIHELTVPTDGPWRLVFEYAGAASRDFPARGVLVDDIRLRVGCGGGGGDCQSDRDCWLGDPCIDGYCKEGGCVFVPNPICGNGCRTNGDCEDGDPCTFGYCLDEGVCVQEYVPQPGCENTRCGSDAECEDGSRCTRDACVNGACVSEAFPGCCRSNGDCLDDDPCTVERCEPDRGLCLYERDPMCGGCGILGCDDGDACTADFCFDGMCVSFPDPNLPGCQTNPCDAQGGCDDGDRCTKDVCENGFCSHYPDPSLPGCGPRQCNGDFDCNDNNPCSADRCTSDGRCIWERVPGCCFEANQCGDNDPCTADRCTNNRCSYERIPGCGVCDDASCNDNDPCTVDKCGDDGRCTHPIDTTRPECRCRALNCVDNDPCTRDACEDGRCVFRFDPNIEGCGQPGCNNDRPCDDRNPCTVDTCSSTGVCSFVPAPDRSACNDGNACTINDLCVSGRCLPGAIRECNDNDPCTRDACANGTCSFTRDPNLPGCGDCAIACNDGNPCTTDTCTADGRCASTPISGPACNDGNACTSNDTCQNGRCTGAATSCDDRNPCTSDTCDPTFGCISTLAPNRTPCDDGSPCTTNDICVQGTCIAGQPRNCDDGDACTRDTCTANGCQNTRDVTLPGCGSTSCTATSCNDNDRCTNDRCNAATGRCEFEPNFQQGCTYACETNCDDNNPCTTDRCDTARGLCRNEAIAGCCRSAFECVDGDICTQDTCTSNRCTYTQVSGPNCGPPPCRANSECNDGNACTNDVCDAASGRCSNDRIDGCCNNDGDCNDGTACTVDVCVPNFSVCVNASIPCDDGDPCTRDTCDPQRGCTFTRDPACGCTATTLWVRRFDGNETPDITIEGGQNVRWRVDGVRAKSTPNSLRYGDADGVDYSTGLRTSGRATGPELEIPADRTVQVSFLVWVDVDAPPASDSVVVRAVSGTTNRVIWTHTSLAATSYRQWVPVTVTLPTTFAGQTTQIRFVFDSGDSTGNLGQGVFFDDVEVRTTCP
jgi:hypothetical protein